MSLRTPLALLLLAACRAEGGKPPSTPADTDTGAPDTADSADSADTGPVVPDIPDPSDTAGLPAPCEQACPVEAAAFVCGRGEAFATVQEALDASVADDLVVVCPGTWTGSLQVPGHPLVVEGAGADVTVLDGGGVARVLNVESGGALVLRDLAVANGYHLQALWNHAGGGLSATAATLRLARVAFRGNQANEGGAVALDGGTLVVVDSTFEGNVAANEDGGGGAFYLGSGGTVVLRRSSFVGNAAEGAGAGLYQSGGTLLVEACTFTENDAEGAYGGVAFGGTGVSVADSVFEGNSGGAGLAADYALVRDSRFLRNVSPHNGGGLEIGVYERASTARVERVIFEENSAQAGGGLFLSSRGDHVVTVVDSVFSGNVAGADGGALAFGTRAPTAVHVAGSTFTGNEARARGGAVAWSGSNYPGTDVEYVDTYTFDACGFEDNAAGLGGAMHFEEGDVTITGGSVLRNTASWYGGGLYVELYGTVVVEGADWGEGADDNLPSDYNGDGAWGPGASFSCADGVCR